MSRKTLWQIYISVKFFFDILFSLISFFIAYYIRFYNKIFTHFFPPIKGIPPIEIYYKFIPFFLLICVISYTLSGYYKKQILRYFDEIFLSFKNLFILLLLLFAVNFFYRRYEYSRLFIIVVVCVDTFILFIFHIIINYSYRKYMKYIFGKPRIGFVCSLEKKEEIIKRLKEDKTIKKFFLTSINTKEDILNFINNKKISELVISYEIFNSAVFQNFLSELLFLDIPLKIMFSLPVRLSDTLIDSTLQLPIIHIQPLSLSGFNFFIKRVIDIAISILILSVLFIPLLYVALLIKLDSEGPIFYIHKRMGRNGKVFNCIKFRTMIKDAHKMWWDLLKYSERGEKAFKLKNDPRITRIGKFLRKYSIDEFPQFFNVLKGDMSIVGPRPQILEETFFYNEYAKRRLAILPGITGLWQISGRADLSFEDMINLDLYYLENWSVGLDLEIILKTIIVVFSKKGAY